MLGENRLQLSSLSPRGRMKKELTDRDTEQVVCADFTVAACNQRQ